MKKIKKTELLAILAAAGVSSNLAALASNTDQTNNSLPSLGKSEQARPAFLADESKCGKGSCGKDEKGAAAAKEKHGKTKKSKDAKKSDKSDKSEKSEKSDGK